MLRNAQSILILFVFLISAASALAAPGDILFEADDTIIDDQNKYTLLSGNVKISQDGSTLTADSVRLNYTAKEGGDGSTVTSVVAQGRVKMVFEDKTASADKAVYDAATQTITLTGNEAPATVTSAQGTTSAGSFVINRASGRIMARKSDKHRVKATLKPDSKGFSLPSGKP